MANKNNDLKHQKYLTLKNSSKDFKEKAERVEKAGPIGWTSGLGSENHYKRDGKAYYSYKSAVEDLDKE